MKKIPFHPFLIYMFPVISLLANNLLEMNIKQAIRPLLVSLILAGITYLIFQVIFRDARKAAILASFTGLVIYSYGFLYDFLRAHPLAGHNLGRHSLLGSVYIIFTIIVYFLLIRKKNYGGDSTLALNLISIILVAMPLWEIVRFETKPALNLSMNSATEEALRIWQGKTLAENQNLPVIDDPDQKPDIYLIILDMYGRQDALSDDIHFDNSKFIQQLENLGFTVASCSRSNYAQTRFSLSNMLNLNYIQGISDNGDMDDVLEEGIKHSLVRNELSKMGYKTVAFATGFPFSEITDADLFVAPEDPGLMNPSIQPFEAMVVKSTFLRLPIDLHPPFLSRILNNITFPYSMHIARLDSTLTGLNALPAEPGSKFVFAHLMIPHPPYIYNPDGTIRVDDRYYREALNQPVSEEYFQDGYRNNLEYANQAIVPILENVIMNSKTPPIVILTSDHGIRDQNRMDNLTAIFMPDSKNLVYRTITPSNYFRVVFNSIFHTTFPILEDRSYYSGYPDRYEYTLVNESAPACIPQ